MLTVDILKVLYCFGFRFEFEHFPKYDRWSFQCIVFDDGILGGVFVLCREQGKVRFGTASHL